MTAGWDSYKAVRSAFPIDGVTMTGDPDALVRSYQNFDATIVSDALDEHGIDGVITGLEPAHPDHAAVGRARPVQFEAAPDDADSTNFPFALFEEFADGDVFVMDSISPEISCWGGLASRLAAAAGVRGTIINGGYRDYPEIRSGEYGVFGAGPTPRSGQPRLRIAAIDDDVTIQGVSISRGDVVVGDATGIAVVPKTEAEAVAATAEDLLAKELVLDRKVENGADVSALTTEYEGF